MANRVTQDSQRVLIQPDATGRVTQATQRVLASPDATGRVTQVSRRVLIAVATSAPGAYVEIH